MLRPDPSHECAPVAPVPLDQIDRRGGADGMNECNGSAIGREDSAEVTCLGRPAYGGGQEQHDAPEECRCDLHDHYASCSIRCRPPDCLAPQLHDGNGRASEPSRCYRSTSAPLHLARFEFEDSAGTAQV
jgi:hypothetical protein